ncbi:MAG: YeeE/YedE family protein [Leptospiraceae bacterium]|nr:YeeE/YedE family protein [Leptospiraceae bacterium]MCP5495680.1 YeeE/YedE family protein [Leptospiraceae bacterium]
MNEMLLPFSKTGLFGREMGIVIAMFLGFGFGFFLERAGFGSAKKLSDNWYGRDFAVIRVMFTAVIVAMIGIFGLHYLGIMDIDLVYINPTFIWPQLVGAIFLGIGFAVGGYCPGTTAVAMSTGKIDGLLFFLGFAAGVMVFAEGYSFIESFYNSGAMGRAFLNDVFNASYGVFVFIITVLAILFFMLLKKIERKVNKL